ncbi:MAG: hypothetical protein U0872_03810 [Planctomycetaceae bacterium]
MLGFRYYMDVIGLDATIVKGKPRPPADPEPEAKESPVFISSNRTIEMDDIPMTAVKEPGARLQFG